MNLILIPLYTHNLSQEAYGQYDLIMSIQQLLAIGITLGVYSGMVRYFNEFENHNQLKNTTLTFSFVWGAGVTVLMWGVNPILYPWILGRGDSHHLYLPFVVMSSVLACLNLIYSSYFAMQFKALLSGLVQLAASLATLLFALYFFLVLKWGIIGILGAQLLGNGTVFMIILALDCRRFRARMDPNQLRSMLKYGTGLMLGNISGWVLSLSDRFLIKGFMNLSHVALYAIGYKIGMLIQPLFINPFASLFTPFKYAVYKEADGPARIIKMFRMYNFIGWLVVLMLSLFANVTVRIAATNAYEAAAFIVPFIAFSYYLSGVMNFYSLGLHIANKMKINTVLIISTALINVLFNFVFIPVAGIYGSAFSTVISYAVANGLYYYYGSKYYSIGLGPLQPYKYLIICLPLYGVYLLYMSVIHSPFLEIVFNGVLSIAFIALSLWFGFISKEELTGLLGRFLKPKPVQAITGTEA